MRYRHALRAVFLSSRRDAMPWLPMVHTEAETLAWIENTVIGDCQTRLVQQTGAVVAFATSHGDWLEHLYMAPHAQGRGLGSLADSAGKSWL